MALRISRPLSATIKLMKFAKIPLIFFAALGYFVLTFTLNYRRWDAHFPTLDYHAYVQMLWNTTNGDVLKYNAASESLYSLFHFHFAAFILFIYPLYLVFRHPLTLYFIFLLIISTSIIPLYFFTLEKLKSKISAWLVVMSFLLYFPFTFTHRQGFAEEAFATPFLFFAFYFMQRAQPWFFLFFSFLTLSLRINMVIPVFLLGLYAIFKSKLKFPGLFICLLAVFWFYYTLYLIYPKYNLPGSRYYITGFFSSYGVSVGEIAKNILFNPLHIIEMITTKEKLSHLLDLFGPTLFLPLLAPEILMIGLPLIILNMVSDYPRLSHAWTYYHSSSLPFIWMGLVVALTRMEKLFNILAKWLLFFLKSTFSKISHFPLFPLAISHKFLRSVLSFFFLPRNLLRLSNFVLLAIFGLNFLIVRYTPNGQHWPFSLSFNNRVYEVNVRDKTIDEFIRNIPRINSLGANYGLLEHTAERKWQFPAASAPAYLADLIIFDPLALTGDYVDLAADADYKNILADSFLFLYARKDLIKEYVDKDFIDNFYKSYDKQREYLLISRPRDFRSFYSDTLLGTPIDVNELYQLVQKLEPDEGHPRFLEFPLERMKNVKPEKIFVFNTNLPIEGRGNLKVEILEGDDFRDDYQVVYSTTRKPSDLTEKATLLVIDFAKLNWNSDRTHWLKLSLDKTRKNDQEIFNSYNIYLTKKPNPEPKAAPKMYYSADSGKTWSANTYPGKSLFYSQSWTRSNITEANTTLKNGVLMIKGTPAQLKEQIEKTVKSPLDYKSVTIIGSVGEKL